MTTSAVVSGRPALAPLATPSMRSSTAARSRVSQHTTFDQRVTRRGVRTTIDEAFGSASSSRASSSSSCVASAASPGRRDEVRLIQEGFIREAMELKDGGCIRVRPMTGKDVRALTEVMHSAFQGGQDERPRARVAKYLLDQLEPDPEEICLVGLVPNGEGGGEDEDGDPIAVVSLSFAAAAGEASSAALSRGPSGLPPPADAAYLCNMAVSKAHRGRGVAKALLRACDELVVGTGGADLWLHVRESDPTAFGLYAGAGYAVEGRENKNALARMFGGTDGAGVVLMRKVLVPGGVNGIFT